MYFGSRGATKFTSFTRRLKRWKFTRISKGPQLGAYYHEYFVKDRPDLLKKIVYPGAKAKSDAKSPSKSNIKVKSSNKARRRASTGSLPRPVIVRSLSTTVVDDFTSTPVDDDPFDVAINSISASLQDDMLDISDKLDISPMPIKKTFKMSSDLSKDFTNWLSDTAFGDNDPNSQLAHRLLSSPIEPASVVSNSSHLPTPPMPNTDLPVTVGVRRASSKLPRRHSCIASIHSTTPSYNVPLNDIARRPSYTLNDVGATASKNSEFGSMSATNLPVPSTPISSYNPGTTDDNSLPSAINTQNPNVLQHQIQQNLQQQTHQQFVVGSQSQVGQPEVEQRLQQMQQQLQQQLQQTQQQLQQQQPQLQHFVGGLSAHAATVADLKQQQQPTQSELQSPRSSFHDELEDFFRFSKDREFTLDDILNDSH